MTQPRIDGISEDSAVPTAEKTLTPEEAAHTRIGWKPSGLCNELDQLEADAE